VEDARLVLAVGDQTLAVSRRRVPRPPEPGEPVTAGVRPEALGRARDGDAGLRVTVEHVEQLGHETLTHVAVRGTDDVRMVARLPGRLSGERGEELDLLADPDRVYVFAADGRTLVA
jgi:ABC-type sugar transport system ATPase subunit